MRRLIILMLALTGCQDMRPKSYRDAKTGCRYVVAEGTRAIAITPALRADGLPDCERPR